MICWIERRIMNKKELVSKITDILRENDVKKVVKIPKQTFTISDNEGNSKEFVVKKTDKRVSLTNEDVSNILDACIEAIQESLKRGEAVQIHGFGRLGLHYRKPRKTKRIDTGEDVDVPGRFVPKFDYGNDLRLAAKIYETSLGDVLMETVEHYYDELEDEGDE